MSDNVRDTGRWLAEQLTAGQAAVRALSAPQLGTSSIEAGQIDEYDADGNLVSTVGEQFDGTHAAVTLGGPVPPEPVQPTVVAAPGQIAVRWSGKFADDVLSPMDFSHVTVHASRDEMFDPDSTTQLATITGESGDATTIVMEPGEWSVLLVAVSRAGKWSDPCEPVLVEVPDAVASDLQDAVTQMDSDLVAVIAQAGDLDANLAQAQQDLTDHNTRITEAEGDLTTAFGQLGTGTVDDRVATAKQAAIDAAATTAQTKADAAKQAAITAAAADAQTKADTALAAANAQVAQVIAKGQSLVRNGDFEAPDGWATGAFNAIETGNPRSGAKAMRIGPNPGGNVWPLSEWVPATSGRTYYLEAWFKRSGAEVKANGVGFVVQVKTAAGGSATFTTGQVASDTVTTASYTKLTATYTPATADIVSVHFAPWIVAGNNTYYVDDMLVVDVTEAQAALTKANAAQATATQAQTDAGNAQTTATNALTMATSKSKVYYSTSAPSGTGTTTGDLWRQRDGSNAIIGEWQWDSALNAGAGGWVKQTVSGSNVSNMDVGYLTAGAATMSQALIDKLVAGTANFQRADIKNLFATAGTLDTAVINKLWTDVVNSRKITSGMIAVGDFTNLVDDGEFETPAATGPWTLYGDATIAPDSGRGNTNALRCTTPANRGTGGIAAQQFKRRLKAGDKYFVTAMIYVGTAPTTTTQVRVTAWYKKIDGSSAGSAHIVGYPVGSTGWKSIVSPEMAVPALTEWVDLQLNIESGYAGNVVWDAVTLTKKVSTIVLEDGVVTADKMVTDMVITKDIIAGDPAQGHARMTPAGFKVLAPVDGGLPTDVIRMGTADGTDLIQVVGPDGTQKAGISSVGDVTGQTLAAATDVTVGGKSLLDMINALPKGIIGWQQFPVPSGGWPTLGSAGGEVGLFEIGWETPETEARMYAVNVPSLLIKSLSGSTGRHGLVMRYTADGTTPTITGNSQIVARSYSSGVPAGDYATPSFNDVLISSKNGPNIRILVSLIATVGSSVDGTIIEVSVEDKGLLQPITGSVSTGGVTPVNTGTVVAPPTNPVVTKTVTYDSTSVQSFLGNNARYDYNPGKGYQGLQPGTSNGNLKSLWTFPSVTGLLAGATVNKVEAYFYFEHWYASAGGTARIVAHGNSGQPTTYSSLILAISSTNWPRGSGRWVTIPSSLYAGFKSGTYKGFGLEGDGTYNTYGIASAAKIRVTYTK